MICNAHIKLPIHESLLKQTHYGPVVLTSKPSSEPQPFQHPCHSKATIARGVGQLDVQHPLRDNLQLDGNLLQCIIGKKLCFWSSNFLKLKGKGMER